MSLIFKCCDISALTWVQLTMNYAILSEIYVPIGSYEKLLVLMYRWRLQYTIFTHEWGMNPLISLQPSPHMNPNNNPTRRVDEVATKV